ncbi:ribonuclease H-like domain-containing protein [Tanacetum coccineum]
MQIRIWQTCSYMYNLSLGWIIDSGENQHLTVSTKNMFGVYDISSLNLTVSHSNDILAKITAIGNLRLTANVVLFDVSMLLEFVPNSVLSILSKSINLRYDNHISPCDICHKAKQTRDPFWLSDHKSISVGDLIHLDLCGPYKVVSRDGYKYFMTIVDDYSRVVWNSCVNMAYLLASLLQLLYSKIPDISYVVHCLSQHMHSPLKLHFAVGLRVLRYLKSNRGSGIQFYHGKKLSLHAYSDADWAKLNLFLDGKCPKMLGEYIVSAHITTMVKPGGGIRLTVVETVWRSLVSKGDPLGPLLLALVLHPVKTIELIMKDGPRCVLHLNADKIEAF